MLHRIPALQRPLREETQENRAAAPGRARKTPRPGKIPTIPVVDLFAGPGGLSEGFARHTDGFVRYDVVLSIEKDPAAHRSLELRAFFRCFPEGAAPEDYYRYLRGEITREELFSRHPEAAAAARRRALRLELGRTPLPQVVSLIGEALGGASHWVLLGGPPCQAYSTIGRARMKNHRGFEDDERHTLYREYLKIVAALHPPVFVMENVKGILSSRHRDEPVFDRILRDMREPLASLSDEDAASLPGRPGAVSHRYRLLPFAAPDGRLPLGSPLPADFVIRAENHGVPQARHRVIILGIREDLGVTPTPLAREAERLTVGDVLSSLPRLRSRLSRGDADGRHWAETLRREAASVLGAVEDQDVRRRMEDVLRTLPENLTPGGRFIPGEALPRRLREWLHDPRLGGVIQHEARGHMPGDLVRYLYAACHAEVRGTSPQLPQFPKTLWPDHSNLRAPAAGGKPHFADRFKVQLADRPASTVMAHLRADGHYFIHPDPSQCRSLTVREAARLQTFPDNYFFEGSQSEQYVQVGNAVPPPAGPADGCRRCRSARRRHRRAGAEEVHRMTDVLTPEQRSRCMSRIRAAHTGPEIALRRRLHRMGLRSRIGHALPGKPDIVFPRARLAVFVDGCFWHRCPEHYSPPAANAAFWEAKTARNAARDREVNRLLTAAGWTVLRYWEHEVRRDADGVAEAIAARVRASGPPGSGP